MLKYGLMGEKLIHSLSPYIHELIMEKLQIEISYELFEVKRSKAIDSLKELCNNGIDGLNITIPYKEMFLKSLDFIDAPSQMIGAINTIKVIDGKMYGYNTDYFGFGTMCDRAKIVIDGQKFCVMGTGGGAKSVIYYLLNHGAEHVYIASRDCERAKTFFTNDLISIIEYNEIKMLEGVNTIINTTPVGMYPSVDSSPIAKSLLKYFTFAMDIVYNPFETRFLREAREHGLSTINGLYMLIGQAIKSQEIWQDTHIDGTLLDEIYEKVQNKINTRILLIGMPGAGKTTVGRLLAHELKIRCVDIDRYIEKKQNRTVSQLFERGESYFRQVESLICAEISKMNNVVVAAGGGIVLKEENMDYFKDFVIIYINRPMQDILKDIKIENRPLLNKKETVIDLYKHRAELYQKYKHFEIVNDSDAKDTVKKIREMLE